MPTANVYDTSGKVIRQHKLDPYVFGAPVNVGLLHQVVTAQLTNRRQGTASTKTRSDVSGGNRKPYRQKGTGRARQGSTRAPQFRGGGVVFGPHPHAYERKIPRKMKRYAIRSALSDKAREGRILLMDWITFEEPRTKDMVALLEHLPVERNVLLLMPTYDENVILSARNLHHIKLGNVASINVVELLKYDHLLMPIATVNKIVQMFGEEADDALQMKRHPQVVFRKRKRRGLPISGEAPAAIAAAARPHAAQATAEQAERAKKATAARAAKKAPAADAGETASKPAKTTRTAKTAKATAAEQAEQPAAEQPKRTRRAPARGKPSEEE
ncbi:MAG TPA: 50S ribosomal protein L4 [Ktedonobacterales bacterium]|nr:50S ribosomal protein L4 [Ktedonobacterales bacterium]